ncbi:MAG: tetratricopeptide repeat protein [candidate division FCPU426 bacterium]
MTKKRHYPPQGGTVTAVRPGEAVRPCTLALCMIVRNEEKMLPGCLRSIRPAVDEIIVVDTGSTDRTRELARQEGARVIEHPWQDDFAEARNVSIANARSDYILWLDADDRVDAGEMEKIRKLKKQLSPGKDQAFFMMVEDESIGNERIHFTQLRLFPNLPQARFESRVHEQIEANLTKAGVKLATLPITVRHTGNHDLEDLQRKAGRNLAIIEDELARHPDDPVMHFHAGRSLSVLEREAEAVTHLQSAMEHTPLVNDDHSIYLEAGLLLGRCFNELGNPAAAERVLRELVSINDQKALAYLYLGESLMRQGRQAEAAAVLERMQQLPMKAGFTPVNLEQVHFQQYFMLGMAYQKQGLWDQAEAAFLKTLGSHPHVAKSLHTLGQMHLSRHRYEQATEYLRQALDVDGENSAIWSDLGVAYLHTGKLVEAEAAFLKALERNPDQVEAMTNLGYLYLGRKDLNRAEPTLQRALRMDPEGIDIQLALAQIKALKQDWQGVIAACESLLLAVGLSASRQLDDLADLARLYAEIARAFYNRNQRPAARQAYQIAFLIHPLPEVIKAWMPLAKSLGKMEESLETIQWALSWHAQEPEVIRDIQAALAESEERGALPTDAAAPSPAQSLPTVLRSRAEYEQYVQYHVAEQERADQAAAEGGRNQKEWLLQGYCEVCAAPRAFALDWQSSNRQVPNYRERLVCPGCGLNNRQRIMLASLKQRLHQAPGRAPRVYMYEQVTPFYRAAQSVLTQAEVTGSEYLGEAQTPGARVKGIRHEDALRLSFGDDQLDLVVSNDVYEHVPDILAALREACRVLRPGGALLFSIPFHQELEKTRPRAVREDGKVVHLLPPQFHDDPVGDGGCLVFYDFGWDILELCLEAGFSRSRAEAHYDPSRGYLGAGGQLLFVAEK